MDSRLHTQSSYWKIRNRAHRYWRKLLKESLRLIGDKNLELVLTRDLIQVKPNMFILFEREGEILDDDLLRLSKKIFPSLYRRYLGDLSKLEEIKSQIEKEYDPL